MVKSPAANAGDTGSIPFQGGAHMPWGQLSPRTAATELALWNPRATPGTPKHLESTLCSRRIHRGYTAQQKGPPLTATRESLRAAAKTQLSQKLINKINKNLKTHFLKTFLVSEPSEVPRQQSHNLVRGKPAMQDLQREAGKPALWLLTSSPLIKRFVGRKIL